MSTVDRPGHAGTDLAPAAGNGAVWLVGWLRLFLSSVFWWVASVAVFAAVWELCWAVGWADPMLLPPPHLFLNDFLEQGKFFDRATRMGSPSAGVIALTVAKTVGLSTMRVLSGLAVAFVVTLTIGMAIRYFSIFGKLTLPTINLLAPISPVAWMPVAIMIFGVGDVPAIFLVFISLFFIMTLATLRIIDEVPEAYLNAARIMGASRSQIFLQVILPAILPGLFVVLRLNLFAAWMMLLIAEAVGVGGGLGLVVMIARSTFNAQLAFFTMTVIGTVGFALDVALRQVQGRLLYWVPETKS